MRPVPPIVDWPGVDLLGVSRLGVSRPMLRRLAWSIAGALFVAPVAMAQTAPDPGAYRDRIIAPQALAPLPPDEDEAPADDGPPRALRVELHLARSERGERSYDEHGLSAGGFWETADHGSLSLDANLFRSDRLHGEDGDGRDWGGLATLWQRNLYLDGGWRLDNGLGVLNTPAPELQRNQYRFFLPTAPLAGASTQWRQDASGTTAYAAFGRAGVYDGRRMIGFDPGDGRVAAAGVQWRSGAAWSQSLALLGSGGRIVADGRGDIGFASGDSQAAHWAGAWHSANDSVQFNLLGSRSDGRDAAGAWIDASARRGRYRHNYGVFSLDPGLAWGALPINQDVRGGYYRIGYQYGRWQWNAGIDDIRSIGGDGFDGQYATAYARYQTSSRIGYGASLSLRHADGNAHAVQLFADRAGDWGQTRLQFDHADGAGAGRSWQASLDQALPLRAGRRLSVSLGYGEIADAELGSTRTATLAFYGGLALGSRVSLDGNARWTYGDGASALRGTDLNLGLDWRIAPRWSLNLAVYQSRGRQRSPFALDPLAIESPFLALPRERSALLSLRYDRQRGRSQAVLGGAPGAATGGIAGSLFLDDNDDGVRAASEQAAAAVTVVLDGRYAVRTDSNGEFSFPRVSVGEHTLEVIADNLPLPWSVREQFARRRIEVTVRRNARVDIPAVRPR